MSTDKAATTPAATSEETTNEAPTPVRVTLDFPVQRGSKQICSITIREPRTRDLLGLSIAMILQMDVTTLRQLFPRITGLTAADVDALHPADFTQLATTMANAFFLSKKAQEG